MIMIPYQATTHLIRDGIVELRNPVANPTSGQSASRDTTSVMFTNIAESISLFKYCCRATIIRIILVLHTMGLNHCGGTWKCAPTLSPT